MANDVYGQLIEEGDIVVFGDSCGSKLMVGIVDAVKKKVRIIPEDGDGKYAWMRDPDRVVVVKKFAMRFIK